MKYWFVFAVSLALLAVNARAACTACSSHQPGAIWGRVVAPAIGEASGLTASRRNPGVLWTHNDGSRERVYAISTNGTLLGTYDFNKNADDLEDIAVGPGPIPGVPYLYIGDIGGNAGTNTTRNEIKIVRVPEPRVDHGFASAPPTMDMDGAETFNLVYPDGSYDAEALLIDPVLLDAIVVIKSSTISRIYRADIASATNRATLMLEYVGSVSFVDVSGGDISHDGSQIILRREEAAVLWARCNNEPIADSFVRAPQLVPVIGPPTEPNGEGVAFATSQTGYFTISEGEQPAIYFFEARCPAPPQFTLRPVDQIGFVGGDARFDAMTMGYPAPVYTWWFNGEPIAGATSPLLILQNLSLTGAGTYQVTASNAYGSITSSATLAVRRKPDLRITEVLPSPAANATVETGDWWELTSFETQPINLSGWRFNDSSGGLMDPFTFPAGLSIAPNESIILVENLTPAEFRLWWGTQNIPPSTRIISYGGSGLGLGAGGDGLRLWNSATTDLADTVASVDFGAADLGISFNFDPVTRQFGMKSVLGVNGVFRAASGTDIGSPGRIVAPATSPVLALGLTNETLRVSFDTMVGHRYSLQARDALGPEEWTFMGDTLTATNNARRYFDKSISGGSRFYRVLVD